MASAIMNVIKEEAVSVTSAASVTPTVASVSRSTISHNLAASAPSARAAVSHISAEETTNLLGIGRREVLQAARTQPVQPVLGNLSTTGAENSTLSSALNSSLSSEPTILRNIVPELRGQVSNAAQQGLEQALGDRMPELEPTWGVAETARKLGEVAAAV